MTPYSRFIVKLLVFSLLIAGAVIAWKQLAPPRFNTYTAWFSFGYFVLLTAGLHYMLHSTSKGDPKKFVQSYMLVTTIKLFFSLIVVVAGILLDRSGAASFAVTFLVLYFIYTIF